MGLNRRARVTLERLAKRYASERETENLHEVETALRHAEKLAHRHPAGFRSWFRAKDIPLLVNIEHWTASNLGWSLHCAEAVWLISRCRNGLTTRVIDVGAGLGLWTRTLRQAFGAENVIGLDPESKIEGIIEMSFEDWCEAEGGPAKRRYRITVMAAMHRAEGR